MKIILTIGKIYNASHSHSHVMRILFIDDVKIFSPSFRLIGEERKTYLPCCQKS